MASAPALRDSTEEPLVPPPPVGETGQKTWAARTVSFIKGNDPEGNRKFYDQIWVPYGLSCAAGVLFSGAGVIVGGLVEGPGLTYTAEALFFVFFGAFFIPPVIKAKNGQCGDFGDTSV